MSAWDPLCAAREYRRPEVGWLLGMNHGVWRVLDVKDADLTEDERARWVSDNCPDLTKGHGTPYVVTAEHVGGHVSESFQGRKAGTIRIGYHQYSWVTWHHYLADRWPQCSCCGEPMPCRAELLDKIVEAGAKKVDTMASRTPGSCWGCGEPIGSRQQVVRYAGENVDLPGGIAVAFHLRKGCRHSAMDYEGRWLAADHNRRRLITYPTCGGTLLTHRDGSLECVGGDPECLGGASHNHGYLTACWSAGCRRGCQGPTSREDAWGCSSGREERPKLRDPDLPQGRLPEPLGKPDTRPECHGTLFTHDDGTGDCKAGRDDCWDGSRYQHQRTRACTSLSHGCPRCETGTAS